MVRDGVTTALELEVGTDSVDAWYAERSDGRRVNHGVSIGHIPVRMAVMDDPGDFLPSGRGGSARADSAELAEIERRIREGLRQGAVAVGFGTAYTPGAEMAEVKRMFEIAAEADADVTIFDPATVIDRSTYEDATIPPAGIPWVIVQGTPVVADGELVEGVRPGEAVRAP